MTEPSVPTAPGDVAAAASFRQRHPDLVMLLVSAVFVLGLLLVVAAFAFGLEEAGRYRIDEANISESQRSLITEVAGIESCAELRFYLEHAQAVIAGSGVADGVDHGLDYGHSLQQTAEERLAALDCAS
jgi:hypothetical protein